MLSRQLDREKETPTHVAEQVFPCNTGTLVRFLVRLQLVLETLLPVLPVSHVSFFYWLLGPTGLDQFSQQSHVSRTPPIYRPSYVSTYAMKSGRRPDGL